MSRILILLFLSFLVLSEYPHAQGQQLSDEILLNVTVTNKRGNYIKGLSQTNFALVDEKVEQRISTFSDADMPASVGILLDRSGSMELAGTKRSFVREALARFFSQSNVSNEYFLVGFNKQPQLLVDWTHDVKSLLDKLDSLPPPINGTALFDACYLGLEKVTRGSHRKHALIVISDGQDNVSHFSFMELKRSLQESDALVYAISPPSTESVSIPGGASVLRQEGAGILAELTTISGGMAYVPPDIKQVNGVLERIATELRNQYTIGFKPEISANKEKYRRLKVTLKSGEKLPPEYKNLTIRSRQGYYANSTQK